MKPMQKLDGRVRAECVGVSATAEFGDGWGVSGGKRE
jgi:hypothetical protein